MDQPFDAEKAKDKRFNFYQRKLTQQLLDYGFEREMAIGHSTVTLNLIHMKYENNKSMKNILREGTIEYFSRLFHPSDYISLDIYNQSDSRSDRFTIKK